MPENSAGITPAWVEVGASVCLEVDVDDGATGMVAEVTWNDPAGTGAQHLTLHALAPDHKTNAYASGDALMHQSLTISTPASGGWNVCAQASGANAGVDYKLYGTVFYTPVPADFTAVPK